MSYQFNATAFVSKFRNLGGQLHLVGDPSNLTRQWFGIVPPRNENTARARRLQRELAGTRAKEDAVVKVLADELERRPITSEA